MAENKPTLFVNNTFKATFKQIQPMLDDDERYWNIHSIYFSFELGINYELLAKVIPLPKKEEDWIVGIVQNVFYYDELLQYDGGRKFSLRWRNPVLDVGKQGRPFFTPVGGYSGQIPANILKPTATPFDEYAACAFKLGPGGVQLSDPTAKNINGNQLTLNYADWPGGKVIFRFDRKNALSLNFRIYVFGFCILAMNVKGNSIFKLGSSPLFTIGSWIEFDPDFDTLKARDSRTPNFDSAISSGFPSKFTSDIHGMVAALKNSQINYPIVLSISKSIKPFTISGPSANDLGKELWSKLL
jgi:hypothetical protein